MCKCLAGNVACCCFNCALSVLISIISTFLVVIIVVGLAVYFIYYYEKEDDVTKFANGVSDTVSSSFDKIKDTLSKHT
ncbi:protein midgut expression 1 [Drosophila eugracilis]|uniref:protein midgut expression 1 n=1 Tax=Drosophila eugracilis TaxID=29029 RepID=UPI0007E88983|nr:protein midgut expression 1 [Drosophila eugracilis]